MKTYVVFVSGSRKGKTMRAENLENLRARLMKGGMSKSEYYEIEGASGAYMGILYVHDITGQIVWSPGSDLNPHGTVYAVSKSGRIGRIVEVY